MGTKKEQKLKEGEQYCKIGCGDPTTEKDGVCIHCQKKFAIKCEEYYHNMVHKGWTKKEYLFCLDSLSEKTGRHDSLMDMIRRYRGKQVPNNL